MVVLPRFLHRVGLNRAGFHFICAVFGQDVAVKLMGFNNCLVAGLQVVDTDIFS